MLKFCKFKDYFKTLPQISISELLSAIKNLNNKRSSQKIIKKGWFSDLEILEIHQKINNEQDSIYSTRYIKY